MPESTNQPGPNQTPIYVDPLGRRRRADGDVAKFPKVEDDPSKTTAAENAALRAELAAYKAQNDARTITGGGFSGTLGSGLSWNPFGANALGPAAQDEAPVGKFSNPYIMGTNSTTSFPDQAANDTWDASSPPAGTLGVDMGAGFGGNACAVARIYDPGVGLAKILFTRGLSINSLGQIVGIQVETGVSFGP